MAFICFIKETFSQFCLGGKALSSARQGTNLVRFQEDSNRIYLVMSVRYFLSVFIMCKNDIFDL